MKKFIFGLVFMASATSLAGTFAPLSNIKGRVLINGTFHSVSTTGTGAIHDVINFDGKNYKVTSGSGSHAKAEIVVNNILTMITVGNFKFDDDWSWVKSTVWNESETTCTSNSDYYFKISQTPVGAYYRFYGNCFFIF